MQTVAERFRVLLRGKVEVEVVNPVRVRVAGVWEDDVVQRRIASALHILRCEASYSPPSPSSFEMVLWNRQSTSCFIALDDERAGVRAGDVLCTRCWSRTVDELGLHYNNRVFGTTDPADECAACGALL